MKNQTEIQYEDWDMAFKAGCRIVFRVIRAGDVEDDLRLGRLAAMALLTGAKKYWVEDMLELGPGGDELIEKFIKRRLH